MRTFSINPADIKRKWYQLDAAEASLGRLSTAAASLLIGKAKPSLTPHIDGGDYVIIINADKLRVTGKKLTDKHYYRHSGYPGGLYRRTLAEQMELDPTKVLAQAIKGMLPVNKLRDQRLKRLKIYTGPEHTHIGQNPENYSLTGGK